jgi:hypothetical protein
MATEEVARWLITDVQAENVVLMDDFGKVHEVQIRPGGNRAAILTAEQLSMDQAATAFQAFAQANGYDVGVLLAAGAAAKAARKTGENGVQAVGAPAAPSTVV